MNNIDAVQPLTGERYPSESDAAIAACNDYLRMGPGRSLPQLIQNYTETHQKPPTLSLQAIKQWSKKFKWQDRAKAYDAQIDREKTEATTAKRRQVMESGLALDFHRVDKLKQLAELLETQIYQENNEHPHRYENLWLRDVKQIGAGESAERAEVYRYNSALVSDFRGVLDDLAKETGGRKTIQEVTGKDGEPLLPAASTMDDLTDEQLLALIASRHSAGTA